ncbi:hypothetical protein SAY87_026942 [Trapa incisa]|uniref:BHLH domain-containing protein n=1 Tax=Trapa incisa TaxID=236973 RepID=A0AAN7GYK4_9MYRT|nr:hypothetical protein SAY87_026942 [Trapa incisa]
MDGHQQQHGYGFFRLSSPRRSLVSSSTALEGSYGAMDSTAADHQSQYKLSNPNLERQSSSPSSGLFSQLFPQNGFAASRWKGQSTFPPSMSSVLGGNGQDDSSRLSIGIGGSRFSGSGLHFNSWTDPSHFSDSQKGELGSRGGPLLPHHVNLQRSSSEMSAMERLLQIQDSVPFKIRAKRGCATHPRSIAERVRRTRISERMRKLQELVPNMDKQTNTADMLNLAVDYIKDLQHQYKTLNDNLSNCKCSSTRDSTTNQLM